MSTLVRAGTVFYAGVTVVATLWAVVWGQAGTLFGENAPAGKSLLQGLGLGLLIVALCQVSNVLFRPVRRASIYMGQMIGPLSIGQAVWLAAISAFAEELMFRGALWPQLGLIGGAVFFSPLFILVLKLEPSVAIGTALITELFGFASGLSAYWRRRSTLWDSFLKWIRDDSGDCTLKLYFPTTNSIDRFLSQNASWRRILRIPMHCA